MAPGVRFRHGVGDGTRSGPVRAGDIRPVPVRRDEKKRPRTGIGPGTPKRPRALPGKSGSPPIQKHENLYHPYGRIRRQITSKPGRE
ncbi:hypothetical protein GCM10017559_20830 [Streptosporangium longisporum]|uniref:Uncharacterized protein n=1 Tax=Streptosporangium longisporum TaxID=46187 RepID=A0ABN3XV79_9ACTN